MQLFQMSYMLDCLWIGVAVAFLKLAHRFAANKKEEGRMVEAAICFQT